MRVLINSTVLAKILKSISYITNKFKEESSFACIRIETQDDKLILTLGSQSDKAIITLPCSVIEQGSCYVPVHKFVGIIQSFTEEIELATDNTKVIVRQNKTTVILPTIVGEILSSSFGNHQYGDEFMLNSSKFYDAVTTVSPFADLESQSPIAGINLTFNSDGHLTLRGCHNAAMSIAHCDCQASGLNPVSCTARVECLQAVGKIFAGDNITVKVSNSSICFSNQYCTLYSSLLFGTYPPIDKLIETDHKCSLILNKQQLERCLQRIQAVKTTCKRLNLIIKENSLELLYERAVSEILDITQGIPVELAINYEYLTTVLRTLNVSNLTVNITNSLKLQFVAQNKIIIVCPLT